MQEKEQKISPIKERILYFADYLGISKRDFYKTIGVSRGTLESKTGITEDTMAKFIAKYPEVSLEWLITGQGSMFISSENFFGKKGHSKTTKNVIKSNDNIFDNNFDTERKLQKTLSNGKVASSQSEEPVRYDLSTTRPAIASDRVTAYETGRRLAEVPVVDIEAAAGGGALNSDYLDESDVLGIPASILPHTSSKRLCICVRGESMEPTLYDGVRVVVRLLDRAEWAGIRNSEVYVVTDREGNTYIKRLRNKLRSRGVIALVSDNPDKRRLRTRYLMCGSSNWRYRTVYRPLSGMPLTNCATRWVICGT